MKPLQKCLIACVLILLTPRIGQAFFFEPGLGYGLGSTEDGAVNGSSDEIVLGGRVGMSVVPLVWVAADANYGISGSYEPDGSAEQDFTHLRAGASVGVNLPTPILDRVWLGYNFIDEYSFDNDAKFTGSSYKAGLGLKFVPFLSVNAEYIVYEASDETPAGGGAEVASSFKNNTIMLSVSVPLP